MQNTYMALVQFGKSKTVWMSFTDSTAFEAWQAIKRADIDEGRTIILKRNCTLEYAKANPVFPAAV
ncbi:MAG: hypothetical protein LR017_00765 [Candidatus Pacebacteria bacterium]|nr:hypothetical protein [Candidatus Paceibacterota bacterium]